MSLFSIIVITTFYFVLQPKVTLPIYSPSMVSEELVEEDIRYIKKYHKINDFVLTNQNGELISQEFYQNKIYVADFFFTTCPDICPIMTENMGYLQSELKNQTDVLLVSFSVTPNVDSVDVLRSYADLKKVDDAKWNLFTGSKKEIYELARKSFLVAKNDGDGGKYDMIHTENFVLVDKESRIRGFYDGTNEDEMKKLLVDITILKQSYLD
ncbi:SCO family protein [Flavobacteriaceae bacterium]|jgi:protein SCO1/2|nr:SCO family protein [Flavobacteriaceae bacterium]MBT4297973.1 SCO family protein [Flavobacteriaceae bacterium]MBT4960772.1 SCO family protein [Flavobacteriaceae bacterium]MBT5233211.1 SCO family protein [Flavobacteriaceae bacterium]MBT5493027.1 SCO family protein [Flavobacteriaceae bacterium]|tara:strand:- start:961 stop:1593 length:633 start_codon:yes stop_codon:yes gene_type:complete